MAVVLPVFLLIIFGIIEFGRAFSVEHLLANAAHMGARRSIVSNSSNLQVETVVKDFCAESLGVSTDDVTVVININGSAGGDVSSATTGDMCSVSVSVAFDDVDYMPGSFLAGAQLGGASTMEHE